ncbi:MAG TPA: potassium transporter TrkA [Polyangia bacterium]|nr:potassium transporter TrkA [Polyangia bacterium]
MVPLIWLLIIAVAGLLVVRLGTTALTLTGLARDTSEFQAYSAFFGVGFTTRESEQVVNHPIRRRIVQHLILAGQVGLTSVIVPLVVTFVNIKTLREALVELGLMVGALVVLWVVINTAFFKRLIDRSIKLALRRRGELRLSLTHEVLLRLPSGFIVSEIVLDPGHPLLGHRLIETKLGQRGIVLLGISRADGSYVGTPTDETVTGSADVLTVYGREVDVLALASVEQRAPAGIA